MGQLQTLICGSSSKDGSRLATLKSGWQYIIQSVQMEDSTTIINKKKYHFDRKLGQGGFGAVYAARLLPQNHPVAIKVMSLATMNSHEADAIASSVFTEILMAKRLAKTSKHIVHMYDFDFHRETGLSFIVMELGEQDLEKALSQRTSLTSIERKGVWRQLVNIAVTLHKCQIVHLDIKPQNLVLFPEKIVKLVDLGIAQNAQGRRVGPRGTAPYSAPEVTMVSHHHVSMNTTKADVWSWGAVLYRMTYMIPPDYKPPCDHPPKHQRPARDSHLLDILRRTLVIDPKERCDTLSLVRHPYTLN